MPQFKQNWLKFLLTYSINGGAFLYLQYLILSILGLGQEADKYFLIMSISMYIISVTATHIKSVYIPILKNEQFGIKLFDVKIIFLLQIYILFYPYVGAGLYPVWILLIVITLTKSYDIIAETNFVVQKSEPLLEKINLVSNICFIALLINSTDLTTLLLSIVQKNIIQNVLKTYFCSKNFKLYDLDIKNAMKKIAWLFSTSAIFKSELIIDRFFIFGFESGILAVYSYVTSFSSAIANFVQRAYVNQHIVDEKFGNNIRYLCINIVVVAAIQVAIIIMVILAYFILLGINHDYMDTLISEISASRFKEISLFVIPQFIFAPISYMLVSWMHQLDKTDLVGKVMIANFLLTMPVKYYFLLIGDINLYIVTISIYVIMNFLGFFVSCWRYQYEE